MTWDLITIGGGAAGFFGAITHAENGGGSTLILEKTANLLGKVKISGGGRCNVTHECFDTYLADNTQAWELRADGSYKRVQPGKAKPRSAQQILLELLAGTED